MDNYELMKVKMKEEITAEEIAAAKQILSKHVSHSANNNLKFEQAYHAAYSGDYSFHSLKRSKLKECICEDAIFFAATFTGSTFEKNHFINCNFENVSLDFCLSYGCTFLTDNKEKGFINANLGNTNFVQCEWNSIPIKKSVLANTLFEHNIFDGCIIEYSSFENTLFQFCKFKNMELEDINLEFAEFVMPDFENVVLPFSQIPYTLGLLENLKKNEEGVYISSVSDRDKISVKEYFEILPQIIPYYVENDEYFPIANIYIALEDYEKAFQAILSGVRKASYEKDFRMLKYFCKLTVSNSWCDREKIKKLYSFIYDEKNFEPMIDYQRHNYYLHLGDFRKILLFNDDMLPTLNVKLQTNILPDETENIALVIEIINQLITAVGDDSVISSVELHHESPYEIIMVVIGGLAVLSFISQNLHSICESIKDFQEIKLNNQQIKINEQVIQENEEKVEEVHKIAEKNKQKLKDRNIKIEVTTYITNYYIQEN